MLINVLKNRIIVEILIIENKPGSRGARPVYHNNVKENTYGNQKNNGQSVSEIWGNN